MSETNKIVAAILAGSSMSGRDGFMPERWVQEYHDMLKALEKAEKQQGSDQDAAAGLNYSPTKSLFGGNLTVKTEDLSPKARTEPKIVGGDSLKDMISKQG